MGRVGCGHALGNLGFKAPRCLLLPARLPPAIVLDQVCGKQVLEGLAPPSFRLMGLLLTGAFLGSLRPAGAEGGVGIRKMQVW